MLELFKRFSLSVKFSNKMFVFRDGIHKMFVRIANRKTLIRLLLQKQSDLGLPCLSRSFLAVNIYRDKLILKKSFDYLIRCVKYSAGSVNLISLQEAGCSGFTLFDHSYKSHPIHKQIQRGDRGSGTPPPPLKYHRNIGFLSNTCLDPLKNHNAT